MFTGFSADNMVTPSYPPADFCDTVIPSVCQSILDIVLLFTMLASYCPLAFHIMAQRSVAGFSTMYILCYTLFATSQFTMILWCFGQEFGALMCALNGVLKGVKAFGSLLGLLHFGVLWIGSLSLLSAYLRFTTSPNVSSNDAQGQIHPHTTLRPRAVAIICLIHMVLFLGPALLINLSPSTDMDVIGVSIFHTTTKVGLIILTPIFLLRAFVSQRRQMLTMSAGALRESCLSPLTFAAQCVLSACVGGSLIYRFRNHDLQTPGADFGKINIFGWYFCRGWSWVNIILYGLGQGILLVTYLTRSDTVEYEESDEAAAPLLRD